MYSICDEGRKVDIQEELQVPGQLAPAACKAVRGVSAEEEYSPSRAWRRIMQNCGAGKKAIIGLYKIL